MENLAAIENVVRVINGAFSALGLGVSSNAHLIAIRRRLVEIAKKRMTTVSQLTTDVGSGTSKH